MIEAYRRFREWRRFRRQWARLDEAANHAGWEAEDRAQLRAFLTSATGRKLRTLIAEGEERMVMTAIESEPDECAHNCARASGFRGLAAYLYKLSASPQRQDGTDEPDSSDTDAVPGEGEREFRERYSP